MRLFPALLSFPLLFSTPLHAALTWKQTTIDQTLASAEKQSVAHFQFTNSAELPVTIQKIESACDCIKLEGALKEYQPGESGEIKVTFLAGARVGLQRKSIDVLTNDPSTPKTTLTLAVNIKTPVQLRPGVLWWQANGSKTTQQIQVTVAQEHPVAFSKVTCSNPNWQVRIKEITPRREYLVEATPLDTSNTDAAVLTLIPSPGSGELPPLSARLRIR